jgi:hypothetical protein
VPVPVGLQVGAQSAVKMIDLRFDRMKKLQSQEKNKQTYSWSCFYTTSGIFIVLLIACSAGVYMYQTLMDSKCRQPRASLPPATLDLDSPYTLTPAPADALKDLVLDVENLLADTSDFLCTNEEVS